MTFNKAFLSQIFFLLRIHVNHVKNEKENTVDSRYFVIYRYLLMLVAYFIQSVLIIILLKMY